MVSTHRHYTNVHTTKNKAYNPLPSDRYHRVTSYFSGYAVKRTETVQLGTCQPHFDDFGRLSDQYLQFAVSYTQISEFTVILSIMN